MHTLYSMQLHYCYSNYNNVTFVIKNTGFVSLRNVSALYYYGETCSVSGKNILTLRNCIIFSNTGNPKMFEIILYNPRCIYLRLTVDLNSQRQNIISFIECIFFNNHNINSMIHVTPASSRPITGSISITKSLFCSNINVHFLIMESDTDNLWQLSSVITIKAITISSNRHNEGYNIFCHKLLGKVHGKYIDYK